MVFVAEIVTVFLLVLTVTRMSALVTETRRTPKAILNALNNLERTMAMVNFYFEGTYDKEISCC